MRVMSNGVQWPPKSGVESFVQVQTRLARPPDTRNGFVKEGKKERKKKRRKKKKVISKIILSQSPYLTPKPASQNHWQPESPQVKPQSSQIAMRIQDGGNRGGGKNMADYDAALAAGSGRRSG